MIEAEKKPKLYEQVKALVGLPNYKKDDKLPLGANDCDSLQLPFKEFPRLESEHAQKIVLMSFKIVVNN